MRRTYSIFLCILLLAFPKMARAAELFRDDFDQTYSSQWSIRQGSDPDAFFSSDERKLRGEKGLKVLFNSGTYTILEKYFTPVVSNTLVRIFYYDTANTSENMTSFLTVRASSSGPAFSIGVHTPASREKYVANINGSITTSKVTRTPGWHMFEIIVTPGGTYGKIDGTLLNLDPRRIGFGNDMTNSQIVSAANITSLGVIQLENLNGYYGSRYWDDLTVNTMSTASWQDIFWQRFDEYYRLYGSTDFSGIMGTITADASGANKLRLRSNMALYFYLYGVKRGNLGAKQQGIAMMQAIITDFSAIGSWTRGASVLPFIRAAYAMKTHLPESSLQTVRTIIADQATKILTSDPGVPKPQTGYNGDTKAEENAWDAAFLASAANFFPEIPGSSAWEIKARCMGFHTITRGIPSEDSYCSRLTQTVYNDFTLKNHNIVSPTYANGTLLMLAQAAQSYELVGKSVPSEYYHNVANLFTNFIRPKIDTNTYYWNYVPSDWSGIWNTFGVYGLSVLDFVQKAGGDVSSVNKDTFMRKMDLFFHTIPGSYRKGEVAESTIPSYDVNNPQVLDWFLNSIIAGEYYSTVAFQLGIAPDAPTDYVSFAIIPDTQMYSFGEYKHIGNAQMNWLASRKKVGDPIAYAFHVGDLVNGNANILQAQWANALEAMSKITGIIPLASTVGNHDVRIVNQERPSDYSQMYNQYFPPHTDRWPPDPDGTFEPGKRENAYYKFSAANKLWMVVTLEFGPRQAVVDWANQIISAHPGRVVIIVTHSYLDPDGTRSSSTDLYNAHTYFTSDTHSGEELWTELVSQHFNIAFVISGHVCGSGGYGASHRVDPGQYGFPVYQILADYQNMTNGGNGYLRMLKLYPGERKFTVQTYSPYLNMFLQDADNEFTEQNVWFFQPDTTPVPPQEATPTPFSSPILTPTTVYSPTPIRTPTIALTPTLAHSPTPTLTPTPAEKPGDANNDKVINEVDYGIWRTHFGLSSDKGSAAGDFNHDGKTNGVDYVIWMKNVGR